VYTKEGGYRVLATGAPKGAFPPCFEGSISGIYCSSVVMDRQSGSQRGSDEGSAEGKTVEGLLKEGQITKEVNQAGQKRSRLMFFFKELMPWLELSCGLKWDQQRGIS
jgi:hypothetical protein